ncbi:hypothetical protein [Micromonospora profundi]|uniref:hypothetical protein n=1 Tax=Micromonospora profundi TaxID=1420889 RepID=UPI00364EBD52
MARVKVSSRQRAAGRRPAPLLATSLAVGLLAALAVAPAWAAAATQAVLPIAAVTDATAEPGPAPETSPAEEPTPTEEPSGDPSPVIPAPETTAPPPMTTPPAPQTTAPDGPPPAATTAPVPGGTTRPETVGPPVPPARPSAPGDTPAAPPSPLGVQVTTEDVVLPGAYWNAASTTTTLRVTVANTGTATQRIRLSYTLPAGVTDAGTKGCVSAGDAYRCGAWTVEAGVRFSSVLRLRVAGTAWERMPLSGSVRVVGDAPDVPGEATDDQGFAVLFPPGPPAPGISLSADEVAFDISGAASSLVVRLGNTGKVDAAGLIEVVLPAGVSVPNPPAGCTAADAGRARCDVGPLPAGETGEVRLPVEATPQAQRNAPLSGAAIGQLDPRSGPTRRVQMSFRITAAAALATPVMSPPAPTGSQGVLPAGAAGDDTGMTSVQRTAALLVAVSALLVVLALVLATTSLRRRFSEPVPGPAAESVD